MMMRAASGVGDAVGAVVGANADSLVVCTVLEPGMTCSRSWNARNGKDVFLFDAQEHTAELH